MFVVIEVGALKDQGCPLSVDRVWQVSSSNRVLFHPAIPSFPLGADDIRGAPSGCKVMKRVLGSGWRYTVSNLGQSSKPQSEGFVRFDYNREEYSRSKISLQNYRHDVALTDAVMD
jgi:hypothetical protein